MTTNKRDLKAYSRFDGTGRIVPGSTVLRRNKPKNGNWKEVQAYECCDGGGGTPLSNTTICTTFDSEGLGVSVYKIDLASTDFRIEFFTTSNVPLTTYEMLVEYFNTNFSFLGQFTYTAPNQVCLQISTGAVTGTQVQINPDPLDWSFEIIVL